MHQVYKIDHILLTGKQNSIMQCLSATLSAGAVSLTENQ